MPSTSWPETWPGVWPGRSIRCTRGLPSYSFRLRAELGYTPLYARYNTGLHISANGRELAKLLEHVTQAWPTTVHQVALIGHSMGACF
jgi:pimeloyl-ACP methyl ester carboxylesterase